MLPHANLGGRDQTMSNGEQPRFAIRMPVLVNRNSFKAKVDGGEMYASCDAGLAQDGGGKQRPSHAKCCRTGSSFQASRATIACSTAGKFSACLNTPRSLYTAQTFRAQGPSRFMRANAPSRLQHVAGDGQLVTGGTNITRGIIQEKFFHLDQLAVEP